MRSLVDQILADSAASGGGKAGSATSQGPLVLVIAARGEVGAVLQGAQRPASGATYTVPGSALADWTPISLSERLLVLQCGVGKANAAAGAMFAIAQLRASAVLSLGICGVLPPCDLETTDRVAGGAVSGVGKAEIGSTILATASAYADEGIICPPEAFQSVAEMGFPMGPFPDSGVPCSPRIFDVLRPLATHTGTIATVSTCSGTDRAAATVVSRTGAIAEAMEGAAIAHVVAKWNETLPRGASQIALGELRVVSNTTGDRPAQVWNIRAAFERLSLVVSQML